jgi:hypothetical protein
MILYWQHFIKRFNLFAASVAKWVIKQPIAGITPTTKINLDHLVFKNDMMLHVQCDQLSTAAANTITATPKLTCTYCHCQNHTEEYCFKKKADQRNKSSHTTSNEAADVILVAAPKELGLATYSQDFRYHFYW